MVKNRLFFLFLLPIIFLVFALPFVAADFSIQLGSASVSVCPTSTVLIQDVVTSTGEAPYSVSISGPAASFTTAVPPGFYLTAGQSQTVYLYITPPSTTMPGTYDLVLSVESQGTTQQANHQVIVENCHLTSLTTQETIVEICSCDERDIILELDNQGNYLERYELTVGGAASAWLTLSPEDIDLLPGNTAQVIAHLNVPCDKSGDYETTFNVKSTNSIAQDSESVLIKVYPCYDYILSTEKNYYEVCENKELTIPVSIKNTGTQDNVYQINFQAPSWISIDKREISINKGETGNLNILASPPLRTLGEFTATVEVMSIDGKVIKEQDIKISSVKCYDVSIAIAEEKQIICNGLSATYALNIENLGMFEATYDFILEAPSWVSLSEKQMTLETGEKKSLSLTISPPEDAIAQDYNVKIIAKETETKLSAEDSLIVTTATREQCYKPSITTEEDSIEVAQDSTATILFIIENKGTQEAIYDIETSGTGTQFSQINPGTVTIAPNKAENLYLYTAPSPEIEIESYTMTVTARLKDTTILASKTVTIDVTEKKSEDLITGEVVGEEETQPSFFTSFFGGIINFFKSVFSFEEVEAEEKEGLPIIEIGEEEEENITEQEEEIEEEEEIVEEPEEEFCAKGGTEEKMSFEEAKQIALDSECVEEGDLKETYYCNEVTGTWWFDLDIEKEGCNPACVVDVVTGEAEINWRCTGVIEPEENVTEEEEPEEVEEIGEEEIEEEEEIVVTGTGPQLVEDIPEINIEKGKAYTFDLNDHFGHPEDKEMFYTAVKPLNVTLQMVKNVVTIKPDPEFEGERVIIFYASDGEETKMSNEVKLFVGEAVEVKGAIDFSKILSAYRYYFIGAAVILVIIIILLSGLGEKIVAFFEEEVEEKPGTGKPSKPGMKPAEKKK